MIAGLLTIGACAYTANALWDRERRNLKKTWLKTMEENKLINSNGETYHIAKCHETEYGYLMIVSIPVGFSFEELEKKKDILQNNLHGLIEMEHFMLNGWIRIRLYTKPMKNLKFEPVPTKPYELYIGYTHSKQLIVNMNTFPHLLIAGINGSGKTRGLYTILTNLVHNHNKSEIELYISQITKTDLFIYQDCEQVKGFAKDLESSYQMYLQVYEELKRREKIIESCMDQKIYNIEEYNEKIKPNMTYIYVISDEFSFYTPDNTDSKEEKAIKEACLDMLKKIIKIGRAYGIFLITALQRTTNDQMPMLLKSQVNTKITYKQTDVHSSRNIINSDDATQLKPREAIAIYDNQYRLMTPFIDATINEKYIANRKVRPDKRISLEVKLKPINAVSDSNVVSITDGVKKRGKRHADK